MTNEFRKALDLIKKTGDKLVFFDAANDSSFVVLPIDDYQKLLLVESTVEGLTEEGLLAKINRDIARWREEQQSNKIGISEEEIIGSLADKNEEGRDDDKKDITKAIDETNDDIYQFEPIEEE
ncbi:MAG: hypothetical protein WC310_04855 [Patescibacteria group bacterium]|jgi:hypothetical protein